MSGIRISNIWAREDEYGKGHGENLWFAPPPNSYISLSYSRSTNVLRTPGSKKFATVAYGAISGSWNWSFALDYNYMKPLLLAFEGYSVVNNNDGTYTHTLYKKDGARVPSFVIRRKQLNRMVGGPAKSDEVVEAVGCVVKSIKFNMQAGTSQIMVSMSGSYADAHMITGDLDSTDYEAYSGDLAEFSCMFMGDAKCENYVANVDSMSVSVDNSSNTLYSTCTPLSKEYNEGNSEFSFSASCYSNNPDMFKKRVFSGGADNTFSRSRMKNLSPASKIVLATYNKSADDDNITAQEAITTSTRSVMFTISDCIMKNIEWQRGDDAKIMDQISSAQCRDITITIRNGVTDLEWEDTNHQITSKDPTQGV